VACRTLAKRGKSLVPESRMLMDESSNCMLERRDETQLSRVFVVLMVSRGICDGLEAMFIVDQAKQSDSHVKVTAGTVVP
jgi:hypothetical protein